jgi:hypothetical protein
MKDLARLDQILLEVHGPFEQVRNVLQTTDGVEEVIAQDGQASGSAAFQVRTRGGKDLREAIAQRITRNGWGILQLDARRRSVEDHFLDIVAPEQSATGK